VGNGASVETNEHKVLVTGASRGIGLAIALELAAAGFEVVAGVRDDDGASGVSAAAATRGVDVRTVTLDVTDEEACRRVVDAERPWGLVNNAGYAQSGAVTEVADDDARAQLETLVLAPVRLARLAVPHMRASGGGRIVNISSITAEIPSPLLGWYQAAKQAMEGVSDAMRLELKADGVDVVLVQPGAVQTDIWADTRDRLPAVTRFEPTASRWSTFTRRLEPYMTSPEAVARVVRGALTAERPRDRYPVGVDAQLLTRVARFVPVPVIDAATRTVLSLRARSTPDAA
jgi:NAD(P)-dependent dehydrogenase (short-subunit alcohol dehydrogenase family)